MAKDVFHDIVRQALEKDGWLVTHDPYRLSALGREAQVDLGAEKNFIAAEKGIEKIAVEVKSFLNPSFTYDFHLALGQYLNYILLLEEQEPNRQLYLAVGQHIYETYFNNLAVQKAISRYAIKVLVFDAQQQIIKSWIE
jgi:XisH protein